MSSSVTSTTVQCSSSKGSESAPSCVTQGSNYKHKHNTDQYGFWLISQVAVNQSKPTQQHTEAFKYKINYYDTEGKEDGYDCQTRMFEIQVQSLCKLENAKNIN